MPTRLVGTVLVVMSTSASGDDNSWLKRNLDDFTDEVEFSLSIASEGLLQSKGVDGAMLFFVCSPRARWEQPLELPDGRVLGRERLEGFRAWFAFVGDAVRGVTPFRRPDWMAEVVGDGFDVTMRLRFDDDPMVGGSWEWVRNEDGGLVFVPDSMRLKIAQMSVDRRAGVRSERLIAQVQRLAVHQFDLGRARGNLDRFVSRCPILTDDDTVEETEANARQ
ncbi:MAG: hypothetical protein OXQ90_00185 [Gammaproteobacteria bacterium]|nr:hypothetical protein [Gammaproteobacteria bacterium]